MGQDTDNDPGPATPDPAADGSELREDELEKVSGGIALLVPAVQKIRDTAARSIQTEGITIPHEKISR